MRLGTGVKRPRWKNLEGFREFCAIMVVRASHGEVLGYTLVNATFSFENDDIVVSTYVELSYKMWDTDWDGDVRFRAGQ